MTISHKSTPDPQEPEQQRPGGPLPQDDATQRLNPTGSPMGMPNSVRPGVAAPTPSRNAGGQFFAPGTQGGAMNAVPQAPHPPSLPGMPAPITNTHNQGYNNNPVPQFF